MQQFQGLAKDIENNNNKAKTANEIDVNDEKQYVSSKALGQSGSKIKGFVEGTNYSNNLVLFDEQGGLKTSEQTLLEVQTEFKRDIIDSLNPLFDEKADKQTVNLRFQDIETSLSQKANADEFNDKLSQKADKIEVDEALETKANLSEENSEGISANSVVIGSPNGDGTLYKSNLTIGNLDTVDFSVPVIIRGLYDGEVPTYEIGASSISIRDVAKKDDILKESLISPIDDGYILIGSQEPSEQGYIASSSKHINDLLTTEYLKGKTGDVVVTNKIGDNKFTIVNSGFNLYEDLDQTLIANGTVEAEVQSIEITRDNDLNEFALRDWITIYLEIPKASAKEPLAVLLDNATAGYIVNGLNTSASYVRFSLRWNGRRWENYAIAGASATTGGNIYSSTVYQASNQHPSSIRVQGASGGVFPVGTTYQVYSKRTF